MQTRSTIVVALGVAVLSAPLAAAPQSPIHIFGVKHVGDGFIAEVPYGDLDLRQPAQVRELSARVYRAARTVCEPRLYMPAFDPTQEKACVDGALSDASLQVKKARKRAQSMAKADWKSAPTTAIAMSGGF